MEKEKINNDIEEGCIHCLNYFGIFRYPLRVEEVHQFNTVVASLELVKVTLENLLEKKQVFKIRGFFMTENNSNWVQERLLGNERAYQILSKSNKYVNIIAGFPFVKGIAISGSLSKYYASEKTDIDYFIITEANRLWISRTLLHLFKKLTFVTGHQHYFCMNYLVDTNALKITHPNLYSAIETVTILPVYNSKIVDEFLKENRWVIDFLPNFNTKVNESYLVKKRKKPLKKITESLINVLKPQKLNHFLMNLTDRKWRRKWKGFGFTEKYYNRAFQTEISISKNHPVDYEKKVLNELAGTAVNEPINL